MIGLIYSILFCVLFVNINSTNHSCKQFFSNYQNSSQVPLFLIAGVQKAGTTALAAYLSQHPNITLASKKEVHYFDKNSRYSKNISKYYDYFEDCNDNTMILGEATPFYLASKHGCQRIARHFPQAKMIILLREPVSRAYSEYQMKLRRVKEHQSLIQSIQFYAKEVYHCMIKSPINYTRIKKCLPQVIQHHTRYPKLLKAWQKIYLREKSWSKVINQCFQITYPSPIPSSSPLSQRNQSLIPLSSVLLSPSATSATSAIFTSQKSSFFKRSHSSLSLNPSSIQFNASSCWFYYREGHETIGTIEQSMLYEIQQYQQCIANQSKVLSIPLPWVFSSSTPIQDRLQALSQLTEECIVIKGGISKDYYYRSLYILQLFHCYQVRLLCFIILYIFL